ncbi:MAG: hypothetical protein JRD93_17865 [Deltaproteobacteria bacterium]|nr:hypothetical protein [Deltaproteobacteria bacterium]
MKKNFVLLTVFVLVLFANNSYSLTVIPNSPWQQGFGIDTPAGSGRHLSTPKTTVYKVTNLNDSGPGSLRDALENQNSPKVIIFEVSGNIELKSGITIGGFTGNYAKTKGSYITIAGQTAPSPGITISGAPVKIERNCHDILIQHIRFRLGDNVDDPDNADTFATLWSYNVERGWTSATDIVIDHCSFSWGVDENIENGSNNTTWSNNIFSEGLAYSIHLKGMHSKGFNTTAFNDGTTGSKNVMIVNNIFAHNYDRNPFITAGDVAIANNVMYDYKWAIMTLDYEGGKGEIRVSVVGNYLIETDIESSPMYICAGIETDSRIYLGPDNYWNGAVKTDPWNDLSDSAERLKPGLPDSDVPALNRAATAADAIWPSGYTATSAAAAKTYVLANAGARPKDRDAVDTRIVSEVTAGSGTSALIDCVYYQNSDCVAADDPINCCTGSKVGTCVRNDEEGWPNLAQNTHILTVPPSPNEVQASGYTKLEEWLHGFLRIVEGKSSISPLTLKLQ